MIEVELLKLIRGFEEKLNTLCISDNGVEGEFLDDTWREWKMIKRSLYYYSASDTIAYNQAKILYNLPDEEPVH